jgi:serine/threonine-protein kinase
LVATNPAESGQAFATSFARFRIDTEPPGASVREEGVELCSSTPCDILYKGADAEPTRNHKLTVLRPGYHSETRTVTVRDSPVTWKLAPIPVAPRSAPVAPPKSETPQLPPGYKSEVPY